MTYCASGGRGQRPRRDSGCRRPRGAVGRRGMSGAHRAPVRGGRHQVRRLGRRGTPRRDAARDLRRPGTGGGDSRQELATPGVVEACPGRDLQVHAGDWTAMIGTADELAARGIKVPRPTRHARTSPPAAANRRRRARSAQRRQPDASSVRSPRSLALLIGSTVVVALRLPASPGNDLGRRAVLQHRDDRDGGLRRLQLPVTSPPGCDCSASC